MSNGYNFWLQVKNLFQKHPFSENQAFGIINAHPATFPVKSKALQQAKALPGLRLEKNAGKWRNDWAHFILADVDYSRPANNEGFSNIKVQLNNKTAAPIDYIQVAVSTFEETGKLYKSEYAEVFNVGPLSSVNIPVYSSPKGTTMNVYITQVVSSAIDLQYSKNAYE